METEDFSIICLACLSTDNLKTDVEQYLFDVYEKITDLKICSNYENICTNCYDKLMDISNFINICKDSDKYIKNKIEFNVNTDKESSLNINNTVENHQNFNLECSSEFIQHNQLTENVTEQQVELENVGHSCTICGKFFSKLAALNRHMKVHLGEKSFECDTCGKKFNQKCTLDRHSLTHTGDRPFACNLCGKLFTRKHLIKYHISKLHPNASPDDYDMIIDEHTTNSLPVSVEDTIKKEVAEPELIEIKSDPSEIQPDETVSLNTNLLLSTDNHKIKEEINDIQQLENQESQDINQPEIDYFSDDNNTGFEFEENPDPEEENNLSPPKKKRYLWTKPTVSYTSSSFSREINDFQPNTDDTMYDESILVESSDEAEEAEQEHINEETLDLDIEYKPNISDITIDEHSMSTYEKESKKRLRNAYVCLYCKKKVTDFARHLFRKHSKEAAVEKILVEPAGSLKRKHMIQCLRKKSNYLNSGFITRPVRRGDITSNYIACKYCLGFYSSKLLYRHVKHCTENVNKEKTRNIIVDTQNFFLRYLKVDPLLKSEVFPRMRGDDISLAAKMDPLICAFASKYFLKSQNHNSVSQRMRELAKLLIEVKTMEPSIENLFGALKPEYYDILVAAVKNLANYDDENNEFRVSTYVLNVTPSLKECCRLALTEVRKVPQEYPENSENDLMNFTNLLYDHWKDDMISDNKETQCGNKKRGYDDDDDESGNQLKKRELIPWTNDQKMVVINYFHNHIKNKISPKKHECIDLMSKYPELLSNRNWLKIKVFVQNKYIASDKKLDEVDEKLTKMCVENNPIKDEIIAVIKEETITNSESEDVLQTNEKNSLTSKVPQTNKYIQQIVPWTNDQKIVVLNHFEKHIKEKRSPVEVECLYLISKHRPILWNKHWTELKYLVQNQFELNKQSATTSRNETQTNNLEIDQKGISDEKISDIITGNNEDKNSLVELVEINDQVCNEDNKNIKTIKVGKKRTLVPWTVDQKKIVTEYFKNHIKQKIPPKHWECADLISRYPEVLENKNWLKIKVFIQNIYKKK